MSSTWMSTIDLSFQYLEFRKPRTCSLQACQLACEKRAQSTKHQNVYSPPKRPPLGFMWGIDKDRCFVSSHESFSYHEGTTCTYVRKINGLHIILTRSNTRMLEASILFISRLYLSCLQCIETFLGNWPLLSK